MVSVALVLVALASLLLVIFLKRTDIRPLAIGQVVGIFGQIPLGGITVLTHLNPLAVASHFLLSMILVAAGTSLFSRRKNESTPATFLSSTLTTLGNWQVALTAFVIIFGTVVTGAGPNAGDETAPRFHIHIQLIAWVHATTAITLLLLSIALFLASPKSSVLRRRITIFTILLIVQGAIGFIQFNQGFPELLVGTHLLGVTLVWISSWRIRLATISHESK
jgi:cytochrome c oxidase assembly protein subunit 15